MCLRRVGELFGELAGVFVEPCLLSLCLLELKSFVFAFVVVLVEMELRV